MNTTLHTDEIELASHPIQLELRIEPEPEPSDPLRRLDATNPWSGFGSTLLPIRPGMGRPLHSGKANTPAQGPTSPERLPESTLATSRSTRISAAPPKASPSAKERIENWLLDGLTPSAGGGLVAIFGLSAAVFGVL